MEIKFDPDKINSNMLKLIALNRKYPASYKPEDFHDIVASLEHTARILNMQMFNEYLDVLSSVRQIGSSIDFLSELRNDEQNVEKILSEISKESRELQYIHDTMIAENFNLKSEQAILKKVRDNSIEKISRVLGGGSPINEISQDLLGTPFGELYHSISPQDPAEKLKAIIDAEKQKRMAELKEKEE